MFCKKGVFRSFISQNSEESTCAKISFLIKLQALDLQIYLKEDSDAGVQNSLEWKLRNVINKNDLSQTSEILRFMNKEKQIHKLNIPSQQTQKHK